MNFILFFKLRHILYVFFFRNEFLFWSCVFDILCASAGKSRAHCSGELVLQKKNWVWPKSEDQLKTQENCVCLTLGPPETNGPCSSVAETKYKSFAESH